MAITLDGSNGILSPDFEPSSSTTPTNGLFLPAANALGFATNSTERLRLDASGNLGLGVTPSAWSSTYLKAIQLGGQGAYVAGNTSAYSAGVYAYLGNNGYLDSAGTFRYTTSTLAAQYAQVAGAHQFFTAPSGTAGAAISFTQAMTLDASGNLLVGTTSNPGGKVVVSHNSANDNGLVIADTRTSGSAYQIQFLYNGSQCGYVQTTSTTTTYNSGSDQRLKENIVDAPSAIDSVNAIKVRSFDWKADGSHVDYGYIAQELLQVAPEAVSVHEDAEQMMGVDHGKLTPRIIKALQELTARLEALENK